MLWLIPVGLVLVGAAAALYGALRSEAEEAHGDWRRSQLRLEGSVQRHNAQLSAHLAWGQARIRLVELKSARRASIALADEAHRAMKSARVCLKAMGQTLYEAKLSRDACREALRGGGLEQGQRWALRAQIEQLEALRDHVFAERELIREEHDRLLEQVQAMNRHTARLRDQIEAIYAARSRSFDRW